MTSRHQELAEQIVDADPFGDKHAWSQAFIDAAANDPALSAWVHNKQVGAITSYVVGVAARREKQAAAARLLARGVSVANGRAVTPTLSVRTEDGATQLVLWVDATPRQFVEAVQREQSVANGRLEVNAVRMSIVEAIKDDDELMALPTLAAVCERLGVDPDTLGLDELAVEAS